MTEHLASTYLDARDRAHAATLEGEAREVVVTTVSRYRRPDRLAVGDALPEVEAFELKSSELIPCDTVSQGVPLPSLVVGRPLVLVFGSFT